VIQNIIGLVLLLVGASNLLVITLQAGRGYRWDNATTIETLGSIAVVVLGAGLLGWLS
jgi:hypothetical protein